MKKILIVSGSMNRGGQETFIMNILRRMSGDYEFHIIVNQHKNEYQKEIKKLGAFLHSVNYDGNILRYLLNVNKVINVYGPFTVMHSHVFFFSCFSLFLAKLKKIPIRMCHSHTCGIEKKSLIKKIFIILARKTILNSSTHCLACSQNAAHYLYGKKMGFAIIIENAVDTNIFNIQKKRHENIRVLQIGRFFKVKNHNRTLKIWKVFNSMYPSSKLIFAGNGELKKEVENDVKKMGLENTVEFLGNVENVSSLLQEVDVVIMPSFYEGIPYALIEAQATATPCLISKNIDTKVDLGFGITKFLDLSESDVVWAKALYELYLLNSNIDYQKIKSMMANSNYNLDTCMAKIEKIYSGNIH